MTAAFNSFVAATEEVPFEEFLTTKIAEQGCIDRSWWPDVAPVSFCVIEKHYWIAKFADGTCYTMIEREEYTSSFEELARTLFNWSLDESGDYLYDVPNS
jgi:hypothetical protein